MTYPEPPIRDPDTERAIEAVNRLRRQIARGIALPPRTFAENNAPRRRPIWIGIDWAKPDETPSR